VSLSGGGHRASLFGLGALIYLVDAGKGPEISCVSSVSGGSITNGWVGLKTDLYVAAAGDFRTDIAPLAAAVSTRGTVWAAPLTYAYLALMAAILVVATFLCFPLEGMAALGVWVVAIALVGWLARKRGWIAAKSFDRALFRKAELNRLNPNTDHVICACDLQTAESVYFSGRFVYSYRLGWGEPADLPLSRAVQASACLPGAFAPVVLPIDRHRFSRAGASDTPVSRMLLTDGGVYDNMGTEWPLNLRTRAREGAAPEPPPHLIDEVVVVNGSAAAGVNPRRSATTPVLGELTSLLAVKDVLYDQTTAVRRRLLDVRYRATRAGVTDPNVRLGGGTVQIDRSPFEVPRSFASGSDDIARRARTALDLLTPGEEAAWAAEAEANRRVKTALSKIPADRAARLMRHSYVLTMVNMHVLRDYPLLPIPTVADFERLVT
jgi:predicted acylesterase/phospholipase RssA